MIENQDIEFKKVWKDEWLEWICGFANTTGGTMYIGADDDGNIVGLDNAGSIFDKIPNKIRDVLGILPEIKLERKDELEYIVIRIDKYLVPISCYGKYYLRSGRSNHLATGSELDEIMLKRFGKKWETMPVPKVTIKDLDEISINRFKKLSVERKRLTEDDVNVDNETLLRNLRLYEGDNLKVAAILLFHNDPEQWVSGAYTKIGYFEGDTSNLLYQDEIHGSLIMQAEQIVDITYSKYLKALISYKGVIRQEEYLLSKMAYREIIYNALQHKNYQTTVPIQIGVYEDKIFITNPGELPQVITDKNLFEKHTSQPRNDLIAQTFFKAGFTENWGRGMKKIAEACKEYGNPLPKVVSENGEVTVTCSPSKSYLEVLKRNSNNSNVSDIKGLNELTERQRKIIELIKENNSITQTQIADTLNVSRRTISTDIEYLKNNNIISRVGSTKDGFWKIV